jgi:hypothetical protein
MYEGKRPLGRPRSRREDNIKEKFKEDMRMWTGFIWLTHRSQWKAFVKSAMDFGVLKGEQFSD